MARKTTHKKEKAKMKDDKLKKVDQETALVASLYEEGAGAGFEETTADDYALPFLKLLQKMSPEVDPDDGTHVEGAKPGMYLDSATGELMEEVTFIPCHYRRAIVEWKDREAGGGFVAQHDPGYEQSFGRNDRGQWVTDRGTYLSDTRYFFGLRVRGDGTLVPDVVAFASTQIKKARTWMTRLQALKFKRGDGSLAMFPLYAHRWILSSVPEENDKGSWRGYRIDLDGLVTDPEQAKAAREANAMFRKAAVNLRPPQEEGAAEEVPF